MKGLALGLRFALELCLLAAVAYRATARVGVSGCTSCSRPPLRSRGFSVGLFISPGARIRLPHLAWIVQLALFALGSAGLIPPGRRRSESCSFPPRS